MMMKSIFVFLIFVAGFGGVEKALAANDFRVLPFWRTKAKVLKKITEERAIIVSVKTIKKGSGSSLIMNGGGLVKVPLEKAFVETQKYENLKLVSGHIRRAQYTAEKNELFLHTEAYRYHARMTLLLTPQNVDAKNRRIQFKIINGHFEGMMGAFTFEDYGADAVLMGFYAEYDYKKLPMPQFFVEFGLEFLVQKIAGRMRRFLEK